MRRISHILAILFLAALSTACEDGPPWGDADPPATTEASPDFGATAAYGRRLVFMGPGTGLPTAAIFDFTALSERSGVRRGLRARLLRDDEWATLVDAGWELEPIREPWRILPGGGLKVIVNEAGELRALSFEGEPAVRLEPGPLVAETSPDAGTQLMLRQATLMVDGETGRGLLLDSQLGRAVPAAAVPPLLGQDTADEGDAADAASPASGRPTPIARAGDDAFLVNNSGYYAVFTTAAAGQIAWISHAGRDDITRGAILQPTSWSATELEDGTGNAVQVPTAWSIVGPGEGLAGELTAATTDPSALDLGDLTTLGYTLVSGWIEDREVRRDVFGLVRHVR